MINKDDLTGTLYRFRGQLVKLQWNEGGDDNAGIKQIPDGNKVYLIADELVVVAIEDDGDDYVMAAIDTESRDGDIIDVYDDGDSWRVIRLGTIEDLEPVEPPAIE